MEIIQQQVLVKMVGGQLEGTPGPIDTVYDWIGAGSPTTRTITSS
jgi:hypothetical protein